jgi:hypothetical protein
MHLHILFGAGGRIRTPDLLITNQLLYRLSYTSTSTGDDYNNKPAPVCQQELCHELRNTDMSETERMLLRRRMCLVEAMAKETMSTAIYLKNYYAGSEYACDGEDAETGIHGAETVCPPDGAI